MFKNLVKQFLVVTLACSTFTGEYVHAMERDGIDDTADLTLKIITLKIITLKIITLIEKSEFDTLQARLDELSQEATPLSITAHEELVAYVRLLTKKQIKELFDTLKLQGESTLKMALRLVYAKDHKEDLDNLECVYFFDNIGKWVNGAGFYITPLFSQTYLQYVLPLIEPITGAPITMLDLSSNQLTSLPDTIGNLVNLIKLYLYCNELTSLPDSIGNLVNLTELYLFNNKLNRLPDSIGNLVNVTELYLFNNKLSTLPDSIGNLVNLKGLWLENNQLTTLPALIGNLVNLEMLQLSENPLDNKIKQAIKKQFGHIKNFEI